MRVTGVQLQIFLEMHVFIFSNLNRKITLNDNKCCQCNFCEWAKNCLILDTQKKKNEVEFHWKFPLVKNLLESLYLASTILCYIVKASVASIVL